MSIESCEQLIREVGIANSLTFDLTHFILPEICGMIDKTKMKDEELKFHNLCCDPVLLGFPQNVNVTSLPQHPELLQEICKLMALNETESEKEFYNDLCGNFILHDTTQYNHYPILTYLLVSLLTPIGFFANLLILLTVYKIKRLRNTTGFFICNLAIADILVIIQMIMFLVVNRTGLIDRVPREQNQYIFPSIDIFLGSASLLHVTAVSIERGVAVSMPLRYPRYLSERRAKILIKAIWSYCVLIFFLGILRIWIQNTTYAYSVFFFAGICSFYIPCVLVLTSYGFILVSALKNMKMEQKISKVIVVISMIDDERLEQVTSVRPARCKEIKIALNVAIMTLPFVCGWGFSMTCSMYELISGDRLGHLFNWFIETTPFLISCINPLTYLMFTRSLRKHSLRMLLKSFLFRKLSKRFIRRESYLNSLSISERHSHVPTIADEENKLVQKEA